MTNCKNCGSPIVDFKCPYCGTYHYDLTVIDVNHPGVVKLRTPYGIIEGYMYIQNATINHECCGVGIESFQIDISFIGRDVKLIKD